MILSRLAVAISVVSVAVWVGPSISLPNGEVTHPRAWVEVAPSWSAEVVVPPGVLRSARVLACDRFGTLWVVDSSELETRLLRFRADQANGRWERRQQVATSLRQLQGMCTWGDWIYLAGQGQLVRYRLTEEGLQGDAEVLLQGLPAGFVWLGATPQGVWLSGVGGEIARPGHKPVTLPRLASSWVLVPHDRSPARLVYWTGTALCGPGIADADGRWHWLESREDDSRGWRAWNPRIGWVEPHELSFLQTVSSPADEAPPGTLPALLPPLGLREAKVHMPSGVIGLVLEYAPREEGAAPTMPMSIRLWPAQIVAEADGTRPRGKAAAFFQVKPQMRTQLWLTAVAQGADGSVYLGGRYRDERGQVTGLVWRVCPSGVHGERRLAEWHVLPQLDVARLLDRLGSANPWEVRAAEEEICRRGAQIVSPLLQFAKRLAAEQEKRCELAAARALTLVAVLDAAAGRSLALSWARSNAPPLVLAAVAILRRLGDTESLAVLAELLASSEPSIRQAAALALGEIGSSASAAHLVQALRFYDGRQPQDLLALAQALDRCGSEGIAALAELLDTGSANELAIAGLVWTHLRHPVALRYLERFLQHPHLRPEQRQAILHWWADLATHYPADSKPMLKWLEQQTSLPANTLAEALRALAVAADEWERMGAIAEAQLAHESVAVRMWAIACLRATKRIAASAKLLHIVGDNARSSQERIYAAESLLLLGNSEVVPVLLAQLGDNSVSVALREQAAALLLVHGGSQVREIVLASLRQWPDEMLRETLAHLIGQKDVVLFLAEACCRDKLKLAQCGQALLEALAVWARGEPQAEAYFDRLAQRYAQQRERP